MTASITKKGVPSSVWDVTGRKWLLGKCLGQGGFARVYETKTDQTAVIKMFKNKQSYAKELFAYQSLLSTTLVEPFMTKRGLGHLGIPKLIGHGDTGNVYFIVTQKLFPVKQLIEESYRDNNLVMMLVQLLDILEFMHKNGWTHNDIKYDNIMVDKCRNFFLIDYGLVSSFITATEAPVEKPILGTRQFMSLDAHRGFINPPRGDLVNIVFMLKVLLTTPWNVDKHAFSVQTATLIEKEAFVAQPNCGNFTEFCKAVLSIEYTETPNYQHLKTLLPKQPKVERIRLLYTDHCGFRQPSWVFSVIFQTHILPFLFRTANKLLTVRLLKLRPVDVQDLLFLLDVPRTAGTLRNGLDLLGEAASDYTPDARMYITSYIESWVVHVAKELKQLLGQPYITTINQGIHQLTRILLTAQM